MEIKILNCGKKSLMCENYVFKNNNKNASNIADDDDDLYVYVLLGGFGGKSKLKLFWEQLLIKLSTSNIFRSYSLISSNSINGIST